MVCHHDAQGQLRRFEAFHFGQMPLQEMHSEPISYIIAQVKELNGSWQDTVEQCKNVLAALVNLNRVC